MLPLLTYHKSVTEKTLSAKLISRFIFWHSVNSYSSNGNFQIDHLQFKLWRKMNNKTVMFILFRWTTVLLWLFRDWMREWEEEKEREKRFEPWNKMKTLCSIEIEIKIKCHIIYHDDCKLRKSVDLVVNVFCLL